MKRSGLTAATIVVGAGSGLLARRGAAWGEVGATEAMNALPATVIDGLRFLSELGTVSTVAIVAVVVFVVAEGRRILQAAMVASSGLLAALVASVLAQVVDRSRPDLLGADVRVREAVSAGGWPSEHVAIATALLVAATLASRRQVLVALVVGAVVGAARMAVGVQLPLDVLGGLAVGTGAALVCVGVLESFSLPAVRLRRPASTPGTG